MIFATSDSPKMTVSNLNISSLFAFDKLRLFVGALVLTVAVMFISRQHIWKAIIEKTDIRIAASQFLNLKYHLESSFMKNKGADSYEVEETSTGLSPTRVGSQVVKLSVFTVTTQNRPKPTAFFKLNRSDNFETSKVANWKNQGSKLQKESSTQLKQKQSIDPSWGATSLPNGIPPMPGPNYKTDDLHVDIFNFSSVTMNLSTNCGNRSAKDNLKTCEGLDAKKTENSDYGNYTMQMVPQSGASLLAAYSHVQAGSWKPPDCAPAQRVAVVIPYRNRRPNLVTLIGNLHGLLKQQRLDYQVFVIEQIDNQTFNRGKLINVGFAEAVAVEDADCPFDCFVFHDVDDNPMGPGPYYGCSDQPKELAFNQRVENKGYYMHSAYFGGVVNVRRNHFELMNGFSNLFWGWGGEDDDAFRRTRAVGFRNNIPPEPLGTFQLFIHKKQIGQPVNPCRWKLMRYSQQRMRYDGLNTLNYTLVQRLAFPLYHWSLVDLLFEDSNKFILERNLCGKNPNII